VTLTDERMTRYFMSIHEAAELIVQAGTLSEGGDLFLLDMGPPVRIRDLAENMIRLAGLSIRSADAPDGDIAIKTIGARPGEKLFEELFYDPAGAEVTPHPKIMRARMSRRGSGSGPLADALSSLKAALAADDEVALRKVLFAYIA
jgi:FlaA1/EpsC-like NDP-sugar epimerase